MKLVLQPVRIDTGGADEDGCLVFADNWLVAVLVRLSDQHEGLAGQWYYEHGFGPFNGPAHPTFRTIEAAQDWDRAAPRPHAPRPAGPAADRRALSLPFGH